MQNPQQQIMACRAELSPLTPDATSFLSGRGADPKDYAIMTIPAASFQVLPVTAQNESGIPVEFHIIVPALFAIPAATWKESITSPILGVSIATPRLAEFVAAGHMEILVRRDAINSLEVAVIDHAAPAECPVFSGGSHD